MGRPVVLDANQCKKEAGDLAEGIGNRFAFLLEEQVKAEDAEDDGQRAECQHQHHIHFCKKTGGKEREAD